VITSLFSANDGVDSAGEADGDGDNDTEEVGGTVALAEVAGTGELADVAVADGAGTTGIGGGRCVAV
jgi:hypothetical protein